MSDLEREAKRHFEKLNQSIKYHETKLNSDMPEGAKHMHQREIEALKFVMEYATEALAQRGIRV